MHEIHVARYYMKRGAWLAAANRARYVVENYQGTPAVSDALAVMTIAYRGDGTRRSFRRCRPGTAAELPGLCGAWRGGILARPLTAVHARNNRFRARPASGRSDSKFRVRPRPALRYGF